MTEHEKIELNVPESCPKCAGETFYRMSSEDSWRCYYCDPPPMVKRMIEALKNRE